MSGGAPHGVRQVAVVSTASACGKTTLGRALAAKLGARFVELDALVHGPGWVETPDDVLRARLAPLLEEERWVVDGNYRRKLGDLVVSSADLVVWLDLPAPVWLGRLAWRTIRRASTGEELWNGNRESLRNAVWGRDSLFGYALRTYRGRRVEWAARLGRYPHVRLGSGREVTRFLVLTPDTVAQTARFAYVRRPMAGWKDLLVALSLGVALAGCDRDDAAPGKGATAAPTAVATTRSVITIDSGHDRMATKDATPYTIAPSAELVLELGEHRFTTRSAGPATPDAVHVVHGSEGYYRGTFSGGRVALNAASLDAVKGVTFPGFEAGETYIVAIGTEGAGADGAMHFTPLWTTTVNVTPR